jgi:hypothetical protein
MAGDVRSEDGSAGTLDQTPDLAAATEVALGPAEGVNYQTTYSAVAKKMSEEMAPRGSIRPTPGTSCYFAQAISGYRVLVQADCGYGPQDVHMLALDYQSKRSVSDIARREMLSARQSPSVVERNVDFDDVR